ncbi:MAG TPA: hybrid sensor histidine kinase/response regulator [Deinococcales bacterium]|nr:hybrid sensor histidine kinase/response regulator [Deinococcales bacterium]
MSRVLIASTHPDLRGELETLLATGGPDLEIRTAGTASGLTRVLSTWEPSALVLDGAFPAALNVLRRLSGQPDAPFVLCLAQAECAGTFLQAGAWEVLAWPDQGPALPASLRAGLRRAETWAADRARISRLQERVASLEVGERAKDEMTHMLVHDLKNPVTAVIGLIDIVLSDAQTLLGPDLLNLLEVAREESQHLLYLASNILDVRRMQEGKLNLNLMPVDAGGLGRVFERAVGDVGTLASERHLDLQLPPDLKAFPVDAEMLRRILANLISNAVKHTRRGGRILVSARDLGSAVEVSVNDDGEGIPAEDLRVIFEPYERSVATGRERFDTGMGLTFCRLAVERHGGRIWAESQRGVSSTFTFTVPRKPAANASPPEYSLTTAG